MSVRDDFQFLSAAHAAFAAAARSSSDPERQRHLVAMSAEAFRRLGALRRATRAHVVFDAATPGLVLLSDEAGEVQSHSSKLAGIRDGWRILRALSAGKRPNARDFVGYEVSCPGAALRRRLTTAAQWLEARNRHVASALRSPCLSVSDDGSISRDETLGPVLTFAVRSQAPRDEPSPAR